MKILDHHFLEFVERFGAGRVGGRKEGRFEKTLVIRRILSLRHTLEPELGNDECPRSHELWLFPSFSLGSAKVFFLSVEHFDELGHTGSVVDIHCCGGSVADERKVKQRD